MKIVANLFSVKFLMSTPQLICDFSDYNSQRVPHATPQVLTFPLPVLLHWNSPQKLCKTQAAATLAAVGMLADWDQMLSFP